MDTFKPIPDTYAMNRFAQGNIGKLGKVFGKSDSSESAPVTETLPQTPNATKEQPAEPSFFSIFGQSIKNPERTADEQAKIDKADKSARMIYGLGDALSGFANIYSATKGGVPATITPLSKGYSEKYKEVEDDYRTRLDNYKKMGYSARLKDYETDISSKAARAKALAALNLQKTKIEADKDLKNLDLSFNRERLAQEKDQFANKLAGDQQKNTQEFQLERQRIGEQSRSNRAQEALAATKANPTRKFTIGDHVYELNEQDVKALLPQFDGVMAAVSKVNPDIQKQYAELFTSVLPSANDETKQKAIERFKSNVIEQYYHLYPNAVNKIKQLSGEKINTAQKRSSVKRNEQGRVISPWSNK